MEWTEVSLEQLDDFVASWAPRLQGVVCSEGPMGSGKTTLVASLGRFFGWKDRVPSPPFGLIHEYGTAAGPCVYHMDMYRIASEAEALDIGLLEYFDSGALCLVEWSEKIPTFIPSHAQRILLKRTTRENVRLMGLSI